MGIAPDTEIKTEVKEEVKPEVKVEKVQETPKPEISEAQKIREEYESKLKERDSKISDLSTTISTIEQRQREIEISKQSKQTDDELEQRLQQIEEIRITDPQAAARETAKLFRETQSRASQQAQGTISAQAQIEKLKIGVKSSNPDFDDDVVDYVMERADVLARTGKFKTAQEAIEAATTLVKSKFDGYASKKNLAPPLPDGARAEVGNNPPPAPKAVDTPLPTASEELEARKAKIHSKII
jgi:TolA-binding protein